METSLFLTLYLLLLFADAWINRAYPNYRWYKAHFNQSHAVFLEQLLVWLLLPKPIMLMSSLQTTSHAHSSNLFIAVQWNIDWDFCFAMWLLKGRKGLFDQAWTLWYFRGCSFALLMILACFDSFALSNKWEIAKEHFGDHSKVSSSAVRFLSYVCAQGMDGIIPMSPYVVLCLKMHGRTVSIPAQIQLWTSGSYHWWTLTRAGPGLWGSKV